MDVISQTTNLSAFSSVKMFVFRFKYRWFFPKGPIDNEPWLAQMMAWRRTVDMPLSEPALAWLGDAYMRHSASLS